MKGRVGLCLLSLPFNTPLHIFMYVVYTSVHDDAQAWDYDRFCIIHCSTDYRMRKGSLEKHVFNFGSMSCCVTLVRYTITVPKV